MILKLIYGCWGIFLFFWVLNLFSNKRTVQRETALSRFRYSILFFLALWLLFGQGPFLRTFNRVVIPHSAVLSTLALALVLAGLAFAIWARVVLGKNWSGTITFKQDHQLIREGPYAFVRHPIYTGLLLMFLGTALALGNWRGLIGLPLFLLSFWIKYRQEETLMVEHFGEQYLSYMRQVRALIPYVF